MKKLWDNMAYTLRDILQLRDKSCKRIMHNTFIKPKVLTWRLAIIDHGVAASFFFEDHHLHF